MLYLYEVDQCTTAKQPLYCFYLIHVCTFAIFYMAQQPFFFFLSFSFWHLRPYQGDSLEFNDAFMYMYKHNKHATTLHSTSSKTAKLFDKKEKKIELKNNLQSFALYELVFFFFSTFRVVLRGIFQHDFLSFENKKKGTMLGTIWWYGWIFYSGFTEKLVL